MNPMTLTLRKTILSLTLALAASSPLAARAQSADGRTDWPGAGQLFVGTNYQPFERTREQIPRDYHDQIKDYFQALDER